ncbi:MAG TPA: ABC transporter permease [Pseudoxanthomonas sp.]|nr:ABC transporter permease [Pseudoxanthomonas sp.]
MNAATTTHATKGTAFKWLLKREFWENRGGFFWAPAITGAIFLVMTIVGIGIATVLHFDADRPAANFEAGNLQEQAQAMGYAGDVSLLIGIGLALTVLSFVVFFYSLGSLYDDRRDRSVLFWKSMPVSDTHTVLSKVAWALLLAPAVAIAVGTLIGVSLWAITSIAAAINGLPSSWAIVTHSHPLRMLVNIIAIIPVYAFWALPAVGWLMFCSAWARRLPFLWAVLVPLLSCAMISLVAGIVGSAGHFEFPFGMLWYVVFYRGLLSVNPMSVYALPEVHEHAARVSVHSPDDVARVVDLSQTWQAFGTADLWIGAVIGAALIAAAIYLRRWRESE